MTVKDRVIKCFQRLGEYTLKRLKRLECTGMREFSAQAVT